MSTGKRFAKGQYGYLNYRKRTGWLHFSLLVLAGVLIFFTGLLLNKWEVSNIFTVLAILMVLPAARVLVSLVIMIPYKPIPEDLMKRLYPYKREGDELFFDLVFTSSEHVMHLDALYVTEHQAIGFVREDKDKKGKVQAYFEKELKNRQINMVYYHADSEEKLAARMKKRPDQSGGPTNVQARKDLIDMIRTAIV